MLSVKNFVKTAVIGLLAIGVFATPAVCQEPAVPTQPATEWHGYVSALAGAVSGPPSEAAFAAEYGEMMGRWAQAYVSVSYFDNLMQSQTRNDLTAISSALTAITGTTWQITGRDRGIAGTGGGKFVAPLGFLRPYVGGGGGVINIKRTISDPRFGDVKQAVFNDFLVGDVALVGIEPQTKPLGEIVAGVGVILGHTYVDAAYRFRKVFRVTDLQFSQFSAGVGYKF
jgi:hypothetical protein